MAKVFSNQCRQVMLDRFANISGPPTALLCGAVDDTSGATLSTSTTNLGSPANLAAASFDSLTRSGQTLTAVFTFAAGVATFTHRRISTHNIAAGSLTGTANAFMVGHDQQTIVKDASTAVTYSVDHVLS